VNLPDLYTSRWSSPLLKDAQCVPLQTSRGAPRWKLPYRYRRAMWLAPDDETWMLRGEQEGFKPSYLCQLEEIGAEEIVARLAEISNGLPVVMLCWEDVHAGQVCHRRYVAEFIEDETGIVVPELEPGMIPERPDRPEPRLF
jgi:hypothetical protein